LRRHPVIDITPGSQWWATDSMLVRRVSAGGSQAEIGRVLARSTYGWAPVPTDDRALAGRAGGGASGTGRSTTPGWCSRPPAAVGFDSLAPVRVPRFGQRQHFDKSHGIE
jgi:hypothetical protein